MLQPLSLSLNCTVRSIASRLFPMGFEVQGVDSDEVAPSSLAELNSRLNSGKRMLVASEGSAGTIYADAECNYSFRAWHDWCHWRAQAEFDLSGEAVVCQMQIDHLRLLYPGHADLATWERFIRAEVIGQALYFAEHGSYPADQREFDAGYVAKCFCGDAPTVRFPLGCIVETASVKAMDAEPFVRQCLGWHARGNWGICGEVNWRANDIALTYGGRILSTYEMDPALGHGSRLLIATEADRSATTIMLPEDY